MVLWEVGVSTERAGSEMLELTVQPSCGIMGLIGQREKGGYDMTIPVKSWLAAQDIITLLKQCQRRGGDHVQR